MNLVGAHLVWAIRHDDGHPHSGADYLGYQLQRLVICKVDIIEAEANKLVSGKHAQHIQKDVH
jgi:hypothetical protein